MGQHLTRFHAQHGQIRRRVASDHHGGKHPAILKDDFHSVSVFNDVIVGHYQAVAINDEARAQRAGHARALAQHVVEALQRRAWRKYRQTIRGTDALRRGDIHHGRAEAVIEVSEALSGLA
jgi:ribosomal protein S18 acetylase RimI-like enzyme